MAFTSVSSALKYIALLRSYSGQSSTGGEALYADPVMIKCYPSVDNRFIQSQTGGAIVSKTVLYVSADVSVKEQDMIIFENASPNWFGKEFSNRRERDAYYNSRPERLVKHKTWCCVRGLPQYWNGYWWSTSFDGQKVDGEITGMFDGKMETVKSVPKYFDGFGWEDDAEGDDGLSIQEIAL